MRALSLFAMRKGSRSPAALIRFSAARFTTAPPLSASQAARLRPRAARANGVSIHLFLFLRAGGIVCPDLYPAVAARQSLRQATEPRRRQVERNAPQALLGTSR